ncbi:MAG: hypothetical protein AAFR73_07815 [Pseudomonadota bacterium]
MNRFAKLAISGLTALSLSLGTVPAAQAAPDGEDLAKVLAGLAVVGLIAHAANDRDKKTTQTTQTSRTVTKEYGSIEHGEPTRIIEGTIRRPSDQYQGVRRAALPDQCVRIVSTSRGDRTVYGARCLKQDYIYANQLPQACKLQIRTNNRIRNAYGANCLRRDGWQVARY